MTYYIIKYDIYTCLINLFNYPDMVLKIGMIFETTRTFATENLGTG